MASSFLNSLERKLGVPGKLLIAPLFILLLFAAVTLFSVFEFQKLDQRMNTVARDLAPDTAIGTDSITSVYRMRLRVFDYFSTGNEKRGPAGKSVKISRIKCNLLYLKH
ncbi:hypothetical protein MSSD14B_40520 [Marinobacter salsuginis]|uniref:Uncharacterized protein n=1 Tax=Marinobacter salsuginis TaxID=418719 RepID=A0A5M3Q5W6_9GAMM|nr:hypothetical protein MSSD14B_40520 [Marinobacter salsuginis]